MAISNSEMSVDHSFCSYRGKRIGIREERMLERGDGGETGKRRGGGGQRGWDY